MAMSNPQGYPPFTGRYGHRPVLPNMRGGGAPPAPALLAPNIAPGPTQPLIPLLNPFDPNAVPGYALSIANAKATHDQEVANAHAEEAIARGDYQSAMLILSQDQPVAQRQMGDRLASLGLQGGAQRYNRKATAQGFDRQRQQQATTLEKGLLAQQQNIGGANLQYQQAQQNAYAGAQAYYAQHPEQFANAPGQESKAQIAAGLRSIESSGNYGSRNASGAGGAYQFMPQTWGGYGGYANAWQAPPSVQDARANQLIGQYLQSAPGGNPDWVAADWYAGPGGAQSHPWSYVPPGNSLSIQQYVDRFNQSLYGGPLAGYPAGGGGAFSAPPPYVYNPTAVPVYSTGGGFGGGGGGGGRNRLM